MIFILIGIVLFSALTFTFTRNSRSPSGISSEDARLYAQQIISYAEKINGAVQNIMLQNGCSGTRVSFKNTSVAGYEHAPVSPQKCGVFNSTVGGGMNFESPPSGALTVAELSAARLPAIFVPYPSAVDDHQTANARPLTDAGAAALISEKDLSTQSLAGLLQQWLSSRDDLLDRARKSRTLARPDALQRITNYCLEAAGATT